MEMLNARVIRRVIRSDLGTIYIHANFMEILTVVALKWVKQTYRLESL